MVIRPYGCSDCTTSPSGCREGGIEGYKNGGLFYSYYGVDVNFQHIAHVAAHANRTHFSGSAIMDQYWSLFGGYSAIWILLVFYILSLGKKVRQLEERQQLNQTLREVDVASSGSRDDKGSVV